MKYTLNIKSSGFRYSLFIVSFLLLSFSSFSQITLNKPSETHSPKFEKENIIEGTKKIITYNGNSDFINNVVKFNDLGNVLFYVEINYFGDTMMILNNEYINNKLVKQVINRKNEVEKFINYQYDANGNLLLTSVNNEVIITSKYDKLGFLEEEIFIVINKSDSSIFKTLSYSYFNDSTSKNKFVVVNYKDDYSTFNYKDDYSTFIDTLEYNSFDKIIKSVSTTKGEMKHLTKYSYSDNQSILEINYYKNGELKSFTEYDSLSNKVYEFKFQNGEKKEVEKIEYLYDEKGNWLVKKFYLNLDPNKSEIFQPNYYETRTITYH